jgi:23S rRNA (uridine2552-2'-O)-methyltransferase
MGERLARYNRKDHFHQRAKREGFRSRAAYKLEQIQHSHRMLRRGQRVADLGCWPGGWMQVGSALVGPSGRIVGVDLAEIDPPLGLPNATSVCGDLADPGLADLLIDALGGSADVVLCDAAPKLTGVRPTDRAREEALLEAVVALLPRLLRPGGDLLLKILEGPEAQAIDRQLRKRFARAKTVRPEATRKGSSERYLLARSFCDEGAAGSSAG